MDTRQHERTEVLKKADWDYFTGPEGHKQAFITNMSQGGCLLKTSEPIEHRRWLRIMLHDDRSNVTFSLVGRVVRCEEAMETVSEGEFTLYRYGVQFTHPSELSLKGHLILALSSRNLSVVSCLSLNKKSSLREGFLA